MSAIHRVHGSLRAPRLATRTNRRQFVAWLLHELERRGSPLPPHWTYADLQRAVASILE